MGDWRPTRNAIEASYTKMGRDIPRNIPRDDWDFASALLEAYQEAGKRACCCSNPIDYRAEIVCLDCKAPLHEECAAKHFWPNERGSAALGNYKSGLADAHSKNPPEAEHG